jgi:predicted RecB family nuclease
LADPISEALQAIFDQGHTVGELARQLFPGGVLVEEDHTQTAQAIDTTQCLVGDGASCLYEAAFRHDGVLVRADAMFKEDGCNWTLVEVKSSTEVKPEYITDLGIQTYVLRGAGLPVTSSRVLHLNNTYTYPGGPYDLGRLFTEVDVTSEVEAFLPSIPGLLIWPRP